MKKQSFNENLIIIDGHNFIFNFFKASKLSKENIEYIKEKLINDLSLYRSQKNCDLIVVFDARNSENQRRSIKTVDGVIVIHSRKNESADMVIEELVGKKAKASRALDKKEGYNKIFVVTSDYPQQKVVFRENVYRKSCREFQAELSFLKKEIMQKMTSLNEESDKKFLTVEKKLSSKSRKKLLELRKKINK
ncbi:MAG: NYN domain-containing protein [Candidatus Humimicrobiaceae bacterium]|nr:NYN domain-containing protein [Actinomycetota bacterium]MDD5600175.1 NYN domain-containing protein [Actinomycetota bacterium]MDY0027401.1 NYN domain-containing protein [Candidatus Humimicrobiaceae bacterium]